VGFSLSKGGNATDAGKRKGIGRKSRGNSCRRKHLPRTWHWARAAPPTVAAQTPLRPEFGWITGNLCDLSKG
jgi:hypothetical protein